VDRRLRRALQKVRGASEVRQVHARECPVVVAFVVNVAEQLGGPPCMAGDSCRPAFARLHARRGQLDQSLKAIRDWANSAMGVPERLPMLMRLPIIARVE